MPVSTTHNRQEVNREIASRTARANGAAGSNGSSHNGGPMPGARGSEDFGINTLGARQMRDKLLPEVYTKLLAAIRLGEKLRSEERRVGEEGRSRWAPDHLKKKKEDNN